MTSNPLNTVFLKLWLDEGKVKGRCWSGYQPLNPTQINGLELGPADKLSIKSSPTESYPLQSLVKALITSEIADLERIFRERVQIELGGHLYEQTLGKLGLYDTERDIDLRIITDDEHLARLPWPLLCHRGVFLTSKGWRISLCVNSDEMVDLAELPPLPTMLMVAPAPPTLQDTDGDKHERDIHQLLGKHAPGPAAAFRRARTFKAFREAVRGSSFDIIYYYGHGVGNTHRSRLLFETEDGKGHQEMAMSDFVGALAEAERPPLIAYLNCCQGDSGGLLGAGRQIGSLVPCVVSNRAVAGVAPAQKQAAAFWDQVINQGFSPERAVAQNYLRTGDLGFSRMKPHWFTPVIHTRYRQWKSNPCRPARDRVADPHWRLEVDRVDQFGRVSLLTREMVQNRKPRALAFLWFGEEGQGMQHFHDRLESKLYEHLVDSTITLSKPVRWPEYGLEGRRDITFRSFEEKLVEAFDVTHPDQLDARIRREAGAQKAVVVMNHPHVISAKTMHPVQLLDYFQWWDDHVCRHLKEDHHFFVLGISFQTNDAYAFQKALLKRGFDDLEYRHLVVNVLQPLECVKRRDLNDFIKRHNIPINPRKKSTWLDYLMKKTKGRYEATLDELERLLADDFTLAEAELGARESSSDLDDFGMD